MERVIYSSDIDYSNLTEEDIEYLENYAFDDELVSLKVETEGQILAIADMGLWNGRKQGCRLTNTRMLSEIMTIGNEDITTLYYDGHNVRKRATHHDGTNYILFREVKPGVNINNLINRIYNGEQVNNSTLNYYTRSLKRYVKKVYGW